MVVSSPLFEAYLECSTKCLFLSRGESNAGNAYVEWALLLAFVSDEGSFMCDTMSAVCVV